MWEKKGKEKQKTSRKKNNEKQKRKNKTKEEIRELLLKVTAVLVSRTTSKPSEHSSMRETRSPWGLPNSSSRQLVGCQTQKSADRICPQPNPGP